ncbi:MAG TPA: methyltransferase domain-containing protein [Pseudomonadota bacterium]|nr:methyltransferase domain-containing protein [Pseudomonadota bacterium]HQY36927.1 methyltransferase domain-containing protein [Pseudomonadota bacterium]HRA38675.1 methyltransferase domain-containing protein [Pseudomonadota bacterium]
MNPAGNERNPQARQMADESMVRTLAAQATAIWPQERPLLDRYGLGAGSRVLDAGCGTGEFAARVADAFPAVHVTGVDLIEASLETARQRHPDLAARLAFEQGDAFHLRFPDGEFDLVACRHVTQAVPEPERLLAELVRVTRPGGWVHVLSEDYGMLHMMPGALDPDLLWREGPINYTACTGTDARIGRGTWSLLRRLGLADLRVDYAIVDTLRVEREVLAQILVAWRDGYAEPLAEHSQWTVTQFRAHFDQVIASVRDPDQYAVWFVPMVSGRRPAR